jgi:NarL family two-component system response regulator LiaR
MMQVLVACRDPGVRAAFLEELGRADISATAAPEGESALELARLHRPEIVLLDDELPGLPAVRGLQTLAAELPGSAVVIITGRYEEGRGVRALLEGAAGYLSLELPPEALPWTVRAVMRGEAAIPRSLVMALIELARSDVGMRPVRSALTPREWEVLDLMVRGASTDEISSDLVVSPETVRSHIKHILQKLGVHTRAQAIARARELRRHRRAESAGVEGGFRLTASDPEG